jgi:hypothetical protein
MVPKKQSEIIKQLAEDTNQDLDLLDDVVSFYYKTLRKRLTSLEDLQILVPQLGTFMARKGNIVKKLTKIEHLRSTNLDTVQKYAGKKDRDTLEIQLQGLLKKIEDSLEERREFKRKRNETN